MRSINSDNEAWEDFGSSRFKGDRGDHSANSRESVVTPGASKTARLGRTDSIWDIEVSVSSSPLA